MMWGRTEVSWGVGGAVFLAMTCLSEGFEWGMLRAPNITHRTHAHKGEILVGAQRELPLFTVTLFPHPWDACPILVSPFLSSQQPLNASPANSSAGQNCWYTWCCRGRTGTHPGRISNEYDLTCARGWICGWGLEKLWFSNWIPYSSGQAMMPGFLLQTQLSCRWHKQPRQVVPVLNQLLK